MPELWRGGVLWGEDRDEGEGRWGPEPTPAPKLGWEHLAAKACVAWGYKLEEWDRLEHGVKARAVAHWLFDQTIESYTSWRMRKDAEEKDGKPADGKKPGWAREDYHQFRAKG